MRRRIVIGLRVLSAMIFVAVVLLAALNPWWRYGMGCRWGTSTPPNHTTRDILIWSEGKCIRLQYGVVEYLPPIPPMTGGRRSGVGAWVERVTTEGPPAQWYPTAGIERWARPTERSWACYATVQSWVIAIIAAILPVIWIIGWRRDRARRKAGCCVKCGYDLRASANTCPECGETIPAVMRRASIKEA